MPACVGKLSTRLRPLFERPSTFCSPSFLRALVRQVCPWSVCWPIPTTRRPPAEPPPRATTEIVLKRFQAEGFQVLCHLWKRVLLSPIRSHLCSLARMVTRPKQLSKSWASGRSDRGHCHLHRLQGKRVIALQTDHFRVTKLKMEFGDPNFQKGMRKKRQEPTQISKGTPAVRRRVRTRDADPRRGRMPLIKGVLSASVQPVDDIA